MKSLVKFDRKLQISDKNNVSVVKFLSGLKMHSFLKSDKEVSNHSIDDDTEGGGGGVGMMGCGVGT